MTPDAAKFFLETSNAERHGPVCGLQTGKMMTVKRVGCVISDIGTKTGPAEVVGTGGHALGTVGHDAATKMMRIWA